MRLFVSAPWQGTNLLLLVSPEPGKDHDLGQIVRNCVGAPQMTRTSSGQAVLSEVNRSITSFSPMELKYSTGPEKGASHIACPLNMDVLNFYTHKCV